MATNTENLSALMDSELNEFELRRTLKRCDENSEDADTWRRYHLARTLMREQSVSSTIDISAGVMAAITETEQREVSETPRSKWASLTSMGLAASLTLAVMIGLNNSNFTDVNTLSQSGVIERSNSNSSLMRTSLSGAETKNDTAPSLEVIRLSEGLRGQIDEHKALLAGSNAEWQVDWLPAGFEKVSDRVAQDSQAILFKKGNQSLTVVVKPLTEASPAEGAFVEQGVVAVGRAVDQYFVSVVGDLTLSDADRVAASVVHKSL